ncbi:phage tail tape measure protein [Pseudomonas sp. L5B5]|uniref:phage tail tape measure protein n=1 Tax=Pseudomonas sp. L5B5 TaxID=2883205 RepID=UPI001CF9A479|nr:phage tail tape measure protein [Pseudomonas sp. L5B5]UCZ84461.1 phage tail tape measure protein [Pseudomonas sp. L5B5]
MSSDLRIALRVQAHSGDARREVQALDSSLRDAGKKGARALTEEANKSGTALRNAGQAGATSYKIIRQAVREAAQGQGVWRAGVAQSTSAIKVMGETARKAAGDAKSELAKAAKEGSEPLRQSVDKTEASMRRLAQSGGNNLRLLKRLATGVREEFDRLKRFGGSAQGQLAGLGLGFGVATGLTGSARLDRQLIRTQQTADMSNAQRDEWREEGFRIAKKYGLDREGVDSGFNTLIASGVNYSAAKKTADAIGQGTAVTGADSAVLGKAVVAGASAFNLDLNEEGVALALLQKMTVAGRLGNAELENLADLFPKIGGAAQAAGMSIAQALAFTETLSTVELQPERLGTLAESTLRVFSNKTYRDQVTKASGVKFFNKDGSSRNPEDVFSDLKRKYDRMKTDEQRAKFMGVVFKGMDQDTVRGARIMLSGNKNATFSEQSKEIEQAKPIFEKDLVDNVNSATGAGSRMKSTLGQAIDRMAQPLNKGFSEFGSYLLDDLNLSGEQMLAGGALVGVGGYYAGRGAKAGAGALFNKFLGGPETLKNIAVGKVLEEAAGVTSVFVTNWPSGALGGGMPELPGGSSTSSKGKLGGFIASWLAPLALAATSTQLGGASNQQTDEDRLAMVPRNKLINDEQRTYQAAFYRNRIDLAKDNPGASDDWLSSQAQRLAHDQTGLTASGGSVEGGREWAANASQRLTDATLAPMQQASGQGPADARLQALLSKPLVIDLRLDSHAIQAEVERRTDIQVRRGQ